MEKPLPPMLISLSPFAVSLSALFLLEFWDFVRRPNAPAVHRVLQPSRCSLKRRVQGVVLLLLVLIHSVVEVLLLVVRIHSVVEVLLLVVRIRSGVDPGKPKLFKPSQ